MKLMRSGISLLVVAAVLAIGPVAWAGGDGWMTDFEAAKKKAAAEGKDLLIDFTGSDWCGWCVRLDNEVFSKEAFKSQAPKDFILVELDFPRGKAQSDELKKQNRKLQAEYGVRGFPTIILADASGEAYARTGYQAGGPEKYLAHLKELREAKLKLDKLAKEAEKLEGVEKAKKLDELVAARETLGLPVSDKLIDQIIAADKDEAAKLKTKYTVRRTMTKLEEELGQLMQAGKVDEAVAKIDSAYKAHEASLSAEQKQQLLMMKSYILFTQQKFDDAIALLEKAKALAPNTPAGKQIDQIIKSVKQRQAATKG